MEEKCLVTRTKEAIREYICKNKLAPAEKLPSVRKLSALWKVSPVTVHNAIASLRGEGILEVRQRSGTYVASRLSGNTKKIGAVIPQSIQGFTFCSEILRGIESTFPPEFQVFSIRTGSGGEDEELELLDGVFQMDPGALIVNLRAKSDSIIWSRLKELSIPVICVNNLSPSRMLDGVTTNNCRGGELLAQHFLDAGCRRAVIVATDKGTTSVSDRINCFKRCFTENSPAPETVNEFWFTPQNRDTQIKKIAEEITKSLKKGKEPLAVFALHDAIAAKLLNCFRELNVKVPDDIALAGFDDNEMAQYVYPALTTVRQPAFQIGKRAAELLLSKLDNPANSGEKTEIVLEPELIIRDSSICRKS